MNRRSCLFSSIVQTPVAPDDNSLLGIFIFHILLHNLGKIKDWQRNGNPMLVANLDLKSDFEETISLKAAYKDCPK